MNFSAYVNQNPMNQRQSNNQNNNNESKQLQWKIKAIPFTDKLSIKIKQSTPHCTSGRHAIGTIVHREISHQRRCTRTEKNPAFLNPPPRTQYRATFCPVVYESIIFCLPLLRRTSITFNVIDKKAATLMNRQLRDGHWLNEHRADTQFRFVNTRHNRYNKK